MSRLFQILFLLTLILSPVGRPAVAASPPAEASPSRAAAEVAALAGLQDFEALRAKGPAVLPLLAELYRRSDTALKTKIAGIFYQLSWKSEAAKEAMLADVHTEDPNLRLQVQWALGRVSNDDAVVDVLLDNLENDTNPLFRDKAACGLASDQVHLTDAQKVRLYRRLIALLESPRLETRRLAIQVLEIHTGQRKDFVPAAPEDFRSLRVEDWRRWLAEYEKAVS